jgi:hypothetical protein
VKREEEKLLELFGALASQQQETLIAFAEFLVARVDEGGPETMQPLPIARPESETVVKAVRRLTRAYPMLDRRKLMADTSQLMTAHAIEGRPAAEVIDELEAMFARHYKMQVQSAK